MIASHHEAARRGSPLEEPRSPGRPRAFDRDEALERAMRAFWWHGYEASGIQALLDTMGIGRQSLYNAFGGKRQLYAEALDRYGRTRLSYLIDLLGEGGPSLGHIADGLQRWARAAAAPPRPGCLLANTLGSDVGHLDPVANVAARHVARLRSAFSAVLADGIAAGEIRGDVDLEETADQLVTLGLGLTLRARAGAPGEILDGIIRAALAPLSVAEATVLPEKSAPPGPPRGSPPG